MSDPFSETFQRQEAGRIGMWVFLATEVMLFGGLFTAYACFHGAYATGFAEAARHSFLWLGAANTGVLLSSSLTMALAVHAAKAGENRRVLAFVLLTMGLGAVFLSIKGLEYARHVQDGLWPGPGFRFSPEPLSRPAELFFWLYFAMTGLHAAHMLIGLGVLSALAVLAGLGRFTPERHAPVELAGLYWHFVDVIWIFLFPLFYLIRGK